MKMTTGQPVRHQDLPFEIMWKSFDFSLKTAITVIDTP